MFLQIIPYVADQFDPGVWVFDGENLKKSNIIGNATPEFSVYSFQESFDYSKNYMASNTVLGVYALEDRQFSKLSMFDHSVIIALNGMEFETGVESTVYTTSAFSYMLASEYSAGVNVEVYSKYDYSTPIEATVQNSIGQPDTRPYYSTFNTELVPAEISSGLDLQVQLTSYSKPIDAVSSNGSTIASESLYEGSKAADLAGSSSIDSSKNVGYMTFNNPDVTMAPLIGYVVITTMWSPTVTNSNTITM